MALVVNSNALSMNAQRNVGRTQGRLGTAVEETLNNVASRKLLQSMYRNWPFFRATIDNAELALAKTDLGIAEHYARLAGDSDSHSRIESMIGKKKKIV